MDHDANIEFLNVVQQIQEASLEAQKYLNGAAKAITDDRHTDVQIELIKAASTLKIQSLIIQKQTEQLFQIHDTMVSLKSKLNLI